MDTFILQRNSSRWTLELDYKNIAFQCGICHQEGHLHDSCFQEWVYSNRKKGHKPKPKGWKPFKQQLSNDEEEHNAENQQTTIWEKDTNACPSVQVEESVTLFGG